MIYVAFREPHGGRTHLQWHVGESAPTVPGRVPYETFDVVSIQADGDELELILNLFQNLPHTQQRVQTWYGETSQMIWGALLRSKKG